MIKIVAINKHGKIISNATLQGLRDKDIAWYWVDFSSPTRNEIEMLDQHFGFHPLSIEDCINKLQRPKLDYYDSYTFFVTHSVNEVELSKEEVNFFLGENFLVSFHLLHSSHVDEVWDRFIATANHEIWNPPIILYHLIDKFVDYYFPIIYKLEDDLNQIENNTRNLSMEEMLDQLFEIRHSFLKLRHTVLPMRDLIYRMINSNHLDGIKQNEKYFSDIHDHLLKLTEMIEASRELTSDIRDNYLSLNSHQTNKVIKVLTVITTIFMPLTFIAGIYGMNFENMPELKWDYGYFFILLMMSVIGFGMFFWFKRKGWFK
ncbi:magnesium transporter [Salirhabdus euzebyi]|uniref:Magnesium transport protein CorA n=1 Tax=Salirhabdus euzebyi TaxID=394506 RepID=A0A841Q8N0_9BACI|nr:magnesium/cobalt transporter CorA [Salirhabdus euzebyi]MBB6454632.1 magnesium transporter [Salirhabdus euzebyi]